MKHLLVTLIVAGSLGAADAPPAVTWRGSIWALGAVGSGETPSGSPFLRPMDARNGGLVLDGFQVGTDVPLGEGFTFKVGLMGGRQGELLQDFAYETGKVGFPEAMLVWTHGADTVRIGRMWTFMGMESCDLTAATPASHGLVATFVLPYGQVGVHWRHAFSPAWATDVWVVQGEDRNTENNRGKTVGANVSWNPGGAQDRFFNLSAFTGAEQDAWGPNSVPGAEGRRRDRLSHGGQWTWGSATLSWEGEWMQETLPSAWVTGAGGSTIKGTLKAGAVWFKMQATPVWAWFARVEQIQDDLGWKLNWDSSVNAAWGMRTGADLTARSAALGLERKMGPAFWRVEARHDRLNRDVPDHEAKAFRSSTSVTVALGATFNR